MRFGFRIMAICYCCGIQRAITAVVDSFSQHLENELVIRKQELDFRKSTQNAKN